MAASERTVEVAAPAKINLALHVTGQRADGYHLLSSLVVFAPGAADRLTLTPSGTLSLEVTGPLAAGVPSDRRNLCWRAAELFGAPAAITLDKRLPSEAGIGGGSSDAAAVLRGLAQLHGVAIPDGAASLGADVPVCLAPRAQVMTGIGERLRPVDLPPLHGLLVNPRVPTPTGPVFAALACKDNAPMAALGGDFRAWLRAQRNDLQAPAISLVPVIAEVLGALEAQEGAWMARMSGSGATCFGLLDTAAQAHAAAARIAARHPGWWVMPSELV